MWQTCSFMAGNIPRPEHSLSLREFKRQKRARDRAAYRDYMCEKTLRLAKVTWKNGSPNSAIEMLHNITEQTGQRVIVKGSTWIIRPPL